MEQKCVSKRTGVVSDVQNDDLDRSDLGRDSGAVGDPEQRGRFSPAHRLEHTHTKVKILIIIVLVRVQHSPPVKLEESRATRVTGSRQEGKTDLTLTSRLCYLDGCFLLCLLTDFLEDLYQTRLRDLKRKSVTHECVLNKLTLLCRHVPHVWLGSSTACGKGQRSKKKKNLND